MFYRQLLKFSKNFRIQHRTFKDLKQLSSVIDIQPEIFDALMNKRPVVALESTIITHGMPHPYNLETAVDVENIVREQGAIPATVAILKGRIKIGLSHNELVELAEGKTRVVKTSRRDFPYVLGQKLNGGTTVAGTIICAELSGIKVFATGGIGGVHRDGENSMDISADLMEMGRSSVAVVSSGIKSILDIPRTMEYLETQGVFVSTYQVPDCEFPAFYTRTSGVKAPYNFNDAYDAAKCISKSLQLGLKSGFLIAVPVPLEYAMNDSLIKKSIDDALNEADKAQIRGKDVTPFILAAVSKITSGKSLQTNMSLIKNNARVASDIAVALESIAIDDCEGGGELKSSCTSAERDVAAMGIKNETSSNISSIPLVIGGSILDVHYRVHDKDLKLNGATYKSETKFSGGGVGRNIAEGLQKLSGAVKFISAFGDDSNGVALRSTLPNESTSMSKISKILPTANCAIILDKDGDCKLVVGDMSIHGEITPELIYKNTQLLRQSPIICIDSNLPLATIEAVLLLAKKYEKPVFYEPTDMKLADKPFELSENLFKQIKFISPNLQELWKIAESFNAHPLLSSKKDLQIENVRTSDSQESDNIFKDIADLCQMVGDRIDNIVVSAGHLGVFVHRSNDSTNPFFDSNFKYIPTANKEKALRHYPCSEMNNKIVNASGAGDAFCSGFITGMLRHKPESICVSLGLEAARVTLMSTKAVPETFFNETHSCWSSPALFNALK